MKKLILAALLGCSAASAQADNFVGATLGSASYPDFTATEAAYLIGPTTIWTSASVSQNKSGSDYGIYGGQWLNDTWGWEAGYKNFGSVSGSANGSAGATAYTGIGSYDYSTTALYGAGLGRMKLGSGNLYGKAGLYNASVSFSGRTYLTTTTLRTTSASSSNMGLLIGGGYSMPFLEKYNGRVEYVIYNGVASYQIGTTSSTQTDNISEISVGVDYTF